jgi:hypothetical protein
MERKPMASPTRYTLLLDEATVETLERLQVRYSLKTRAAVFDLSMVVLDWIDAQESNGYEVGREKDGNFQPLLLPVMRKPRPDPAPTPSHPVPANGQPQLA